jgi:hypothetical protein
MEHLHTFNLLVFTKKFGISILKGLIRGTGTGKLKNIMALVFWASFADSGWGEWEH